MTDFKVNRHVNFKPQLFIGKCMNYSVCRYMLYINHETENEAKEMEGLGESRWEEISTASMNVSIE